MKKIIILIPIYNDWESLSKLLNDINQEIENINNFEFNCIIVNDNSTIEKSRYYYGVASHNSIQFDSRDQMPKIGRFLFGSWLKEIEFEYVRSKHCFIISAAYRDYLGSYHRRELTICSNKVIVKDQYSGIKQNAQLKWRLNPNQFKFVSASIKKGKINIDIASRKITGDFNLSTEVESRFYLVESSLPVVSKILNRAGSFVTNITWR